MWKSFPIILFSFTSHLNVFQIQNSLDKPSENSIYNNNINIIYRNEINSTSCNA